MAYETVGHERTGFARELLLTRRWQRQEAIAEAESRIESLQQTLVEFRREVDSLDVALALLPQAPSGVAAETGPAPEAEPEAPPVLTLVSPATLGLGAAPEAAPSLEDAAPEPPELGAIQPPEDAEEERPFWATAGAVE
jgi:uncharacterized coiled-coil protein SlyX